MATLLKIHAYNNKAWKFMRDDQSEVLQRIHEHTGEVSCRCHFTRHKEHPLPLDRRTRYKTKMSLMRRDFGSNKT